MKNKDDKIEGRLLNVQSSDLISASKSKYDFITFIRKLDETDAVQVLSPGSVLFAEKKHPKVIVGTVPFISNSYDESFLSEQQVLKLTMPESVTNTSEIVEILHSPAIKYRLPELLLKGKLHKSVANRFLTAIIQQYSRWKSTHEEKSVLDFCSEISSSTDGEFSIEDVFRHISIIGSTNSYVVRRLTELEKKNIEIGKEIEQLKKDFEAEGLISKNIPDYTRNSLAIKLGLSPSNFDRKKNNGFSRLLYRMPDPT